MVDAGAGFCKKNRQGNQVYPANSGGSGSNVAELSSHEDLEEAQLSEDEVVVELEEGGKIRELDEEERFIKVKTDSLSSDRLEKFFTDEEIAELQEKEETVTGESKESTYDEAMRGMKEDCRRRNKQVARERKKREKKRIREAFEDPAMSKKLTEMKGREIQRVMSGSDDSHVNEEELQSALQEADEKWDRIIKDESNAEIKNPDNEVAELASDSWSDREDYWSDFIRDLEKSDESTLRESVGPNSVRLTTQDEEMKEALRNPEDEPFDGTVELEEDTGDTVIAVVKED